MPNFNPISPKPFFSHREVIAATAGGFAAVLTAIVFAALLATHQPIGIIGFSLGGTIEIVSIATIGTCLYLKKRKKTPLKLSTTSPPNTPKETLYDNKKVVQKPENKTDNAPPESDKKEEKEQSHPPVEYCEPEEIEEDKSSTPNPSPRFEEAKEITEEEKEPAISPPQRTIIFINPFVHPDEEESKPSHSIESVKENDKEASTTPPLIPSQITETKPDSAFLESDKIPLKQKEKTKKSVSFSKHVEEIIEEPMEPKEQGSQDSPTSPPAKTSEETNGEQAPPSPPASPITPSVSEFQTTEDQLSSQKIEEKMELEKRKSESPPPIKQTNGKEEDSSPSVSPTIPPTKISQELENQSLSEVIGSDKIHMNGKIEKAEVKENKILTLDYIETIRENLTPFFGAVQEMLIGFVTGRYKSEKKSAPQKEIEKIQNAMNSINKEVNAFLKDPHELLRVALGFATLAFLNEEQLENLNEISKLPNCLKAWGDSSSEEFTQIKEILKTLCQSSDKKCQNLLIQVKKSYQNLKKAKEKDKSEKKVAYRVATVALVDYLYMNVKLSQDIIEKWTVQLIPPFLEKQKNELLFTRMNLWILDLSGGFEKNGIFTDKEFISNLGWAVNPLLPRKLIFSMVEKEIMELPLTKERKNALFNAAKELIPVLLPPLHCAVCKEKPFHQKFKTIISKLLPPAIKDDSWKGFTEAYCNFLKNIAQELQK